LIFFSALLADAGQPPNESTDTNTVVNKNKFRQLFKLKAVHLLAAFAVVYIGIEVTIGGWIVTYIIEERGGGHSAGYISSGFFGGLMLGRLCLMWLNKLVCFVSTFGGMKCHTDLYAM
jgi:fucose permease